MNAQNMPGMVCFAGGQEQSRFLALLGWQIKAMHRKSSGGVLECWSLGILAREAQSAGRSAAAAQCAIYSITPSLHHSILPVCSVKQFLCLLEEALAHGAFLAVAEGGEFLELRFLGG